jgi:hypothetical protein
MSDRVAAPPPDALFKPVLRLLRPLVRLLIQSGITFPVLADLLRALYVDVAVREILTDKRTQTDSRVSLLTGVHRKEIRRLRLDPPARDEIPEIVTRSTQIIARWLGARPWVDAAGHPRRLPRFAGGDDEVSFEALVLSVTKDLRARAVLDEWSAQGIITLDDEDFVTLNQDAFIPQPGRDAQLFYFGRNLHDHVAAAAANITAAAAAPFLDRSLHYDGLSAESANRLQQAGREAAQRLLVELNRFALELTQAQEAAGPGAAAHTNRVNLGVYLYAADEAETP